MDVIFRQSDHKFAVMSGDCLSEQVIRIRIHQVVTVYRTLGSYHSKSPVGLRHMLIEMQD